MRTSVYPVHRRSRGQHTQTVRRTAHVIKRPWNLVPPAEVRARQSEVEPLEVGNGETVVLSRSERDFVRRHADESQDELPDWAYLDLLALLDHADQIEAQLSEALEALERVRDVLGAAAGP